MKKKTLAVLLCVFLLLTLTFTVASAASSPEQSQTPGSLSSDDASGEPVELKIENIDASDPNLPVLVKAILAVAGGNLSLSEFISTAGIKLPSGVAANEMELLSVFSVTVPQGVGNVTIVFDVPVVYPGSVVVVLHFNGEAWETVPAVAGDGTVTATFTSLSPVAILVQSPASSGGTIVKSPQTGDIDYSWLLLCIMLISGMIFVFSSRKLNKK